jgi:hypothetical protein
MKDVELDGIHAVVIYFEPFVALTAQRKNNKP